MKGKDIYIKIVAAVVLVIFVGMNVLPTTGAVVTEKYSLPAFEGNILYVGGDGPGNYTTIQEAVDNSSSGDTVFVYDDSSPYYESIVINKSLNLIGENKDTTTIDGENSLFSVIKITADEVVVSGFTIRTDVFGINGNTRKAPYKGIEISSSYTTIFNNNVLNNEVGISLSGFSNNISSNNVSGHIFEGIFLDSSSNNILQNNTVIQNRFGIFLVQSSNNNILVNNTVCKNGYGISLYRSANNNSIIKNIIKSNTHGIILNSSSNNDFINNILSYNSNDVSDDGVNSYISNQFLHNLQSRMLTFDEGNKKISLNDVVCFNISMFYANGDPSFNGDYDITTRPVETVSTRREGNKIIGNFTVTRLGTYSLVVSISDENNNTAKRKYTFFVNASGSAKTKYYLRSIDPIHGQPVGSDTGALLFTPPTEEEWWRCSFWVQNSPDQLPINYPLSILDDINIYSWYKTVVDGYIGVQRHVTLDTTVDKSEIVQASTNYTWINNNFYNLNWSMDYFWNWYWLSLKLKGINPYWMTNPHQPSYANFTYGYTTTPSIKSISNTDVAILSATSPADNTNSANIILNGIGTTNLIVQMPNTSLIYSATLDGVECNSSNGSFTQLNGELNFSLCLGSEHSEHTLDIEEAMVEIESITGGFGITAVIKNIGNNDINNVEWSISVKGGILIFPKKTSGTIDTLTVGDSEEIKMSLFGIGLGILKDMPEITVAAECAERSSANKSVTAKIFFFLVELY